MCVIKEVMGPGICAMREKCAQLAWIQWASDSLTTEKSIGLELAIRAVFNPPLRMQAC